MKKLLALLLALAIVFSLVACAESGGGRSDRDDDDSTSTPWWENLPEEDDNDDDDSKDNDEDKDKEDDDENNSVISPPSDEPDKNEDTASAVVTVGEHNLTAAQFSYFYYDAISEYQQVIFAQYYASLGEYWDTMLGFDPELPMDEQIYNEETGQTWQAYFKDVAIEDIHWTYALYDDAIANNFSLSDSLQLEISEYLNDLSLYAGYYGYDDVDAYLRDIYGKDASAEEFAAYFTTFSMSASYRDRYISSLSFTQEDLRAYEQTDEYYTTVSDAKLVNVRHILALFAGSTDADKADAQARAEEIYHDWLAGPATEDSFAALANAVSEDQGGNVTNGGIYEDIYPGQMAEDFEAWCFAADRKPGDTGIVETENGYHVMYFSSYSDITYRDMIIEEDMRTEYAANWAQSIMNNTSIVVGNLDDLELT